MAEQVGRKKSYRWVSAGQASYDGADWDSSDDSNGEDEMNKSSVTRGDTISRLPALPKLNYSEDEDAERDICGNGEVSERVESLQEQENLPQRIRPMPLVVENKEECSSILGTPSLGKVLSRNSSKSSLQARRTPVNEDLENLMAQISKEMTPKVEQTDNFERKDLSDEYYQSDQVPGLERVASRTSHSDDELQVSKSGYFSKFISSKDEDDYISNDDVSSSAEGEESRSSEMPAADVTSDSGEANEDTLAYESDHEPRKPDINEGDGGSSAREDSQSLQASLEATTFSSSDEAEDDDDDDDGDALSYTDSIKYQAPDPSSTQSVDKEYEESSKEDENADSSDEEMRVSKSGYFNKMIQSESDTSTREQDSNSDDDAGDDVDDVDELRTIPATIESVAESEVDAPDEDSKAVISDRVKGELIGDEESQVDVVGSSESQQAEGERIEGTEIVDNENHDKDEGEGEDEQSKDGQVNDRTGEDEVGGVPEADERLSSTRQSINLGKWKPDTSAFRSDFVQETSKNPPPGFVYDESGKLVDLTPSSMKSRIVSTYSEAESAWNAFPSQGNEDLETVNDAKTLYDNNTIHNVPGIISNNQNLPPLPNIAQRVTSNDSSDDPKSLGTGNSTSLTLDGDSRREPLQTHFKEVFTVPQPNTQDIAKISTEKIVPFVDMNKIVSSKSSHAYKIEQLRSYSKQLNDYDTGVQTWLNYTLKSSSKADRDFIFDEYKVSRHVRDAYAHADELSKKHTVSNTVANVNQNVSHLTKKVFAHSKKSRGLFSSIGKKRV